MRILLIDDTLESCQKIVDLLDAASGSYECLLAYSADTYAEFLTNGHPDLVLTENALGWTDGLAVLRDVRARLPGVPVIMVTGSGSEVLAVDGLRAGLADYVPKSALHRLADAVGAALATDGANPRTSAPARLPAASGTLDTAAMVEAFPEGIVLCDLESRVVAMSTAAEHLLGYTLFSYERPLFAQLQRLSAHGSDGALLRDGERLPLAQALRGEATDSVIVSWLPRGYLPRRWYSMRASPVHNGGADVAGAVLAFTDVTMLVNNNAALTEDQVETRQQSEVMVELTLELEEQAEEMLKQNEELRSLKEGLEARVAARTAELEAMNDKNRILLREVNHRVKNNLAVIQSLINIAKNGVGAHEESASNEGAVSHNQQLDTTLDNLMDRIQSLATVHDLLSASSWRSLRVSSLVNEIVRTLLQTAGNASSSFLEVEESDLYISPQQAHHLALVMGELATNTVKYGGGEQGIYVVVDVGMVDNQVCIVYRSQGADYPARVLAGEDHSVGLNLINMIVGHSLRGTWSIRNDHGAVTEIHFPVLTTL